MRRVEPIKGGFREETAPRAILCFPFTLIVGDSGFDANSRCRVIDANLVSRSCNLYLLQGFTPEPAARCVLVPSQLRGSRAAPDTERVWCDLPSAVMTENRPRLLSRPNFLRNAEPFG